MCLSSPYSVTVTLTQIARDIRADLRLGEMSPVRVRNLG